MTRSAAVDVDGVIGSPIASNVEPRYSTRRFAILGRAA